MTRDLYGDRRDGEATPARRITLLDIVRGRLPGPRRAGAAQPGESIERVLYVHPDDAELAARYVELRPDLGGLAGVRVIATPLVGFGAVKATRPGDIELAAALMRALSLARGYRPVGLSIR